MDDLQVKIMTLLKKGYGAEDIAQILTTEKETISLKSVRSEIKKLRAMGFLAVLFDNKKKVTK